MFSLIFGRRYSWDSLERWSIWRSTRSSSCVDFWLCLCVVHLSRQTASTQQALGKWLAAVVTEKFLLCPFRTNFGPTRYAVPASQKFLNHNYSKAFPDQPLKMITAGQLISEEYATATIGMKEGVVDLIVHVNRDATNESCKSWNINTLFLWFLHAASTACSSSRISCDFS